MRSFAAIIHAYLAADATLSGLCPGGIYLYTALPPNGVTRDTRPSAFLDGKLRPIIKVKGRDVGNRPNAPYDPVEQYQVGTQVIEIYIQADQGQAFTTLDTIGARVRELLHERNNAFISVDLFRLEHERVFEHYRDSGMNQAITLRHDYLIEGV
jgi:hypothetical protein